MIGTVDGLRRTSNYSPNSFFLHTYLVTPYDEAARFEVQVAT